MSSRTLLACSAQVHVVALVILDREHLNELVRRAHAHHFASKIVSLRRLQRAEASDALPRSRTFRCRRRATCSLCVKGWPWRFQASRRAFCCFSGSEVLPRVPRRLDQLRQRNEHQLRLLCLAICAVLCAEMRVMRRSATLVEHFVRRARALAHDQAQIRPWRAARRRRRARRTPRACDRTRDECRASSRRCSAVFACSSLIRSSASVAAWAIMPTVSSSAEIHQGRRQPRYRRA